MIKAAYAEYALDLKEVRLKSSSGGAFNRIAHEILNNNGIVYGVKFDKIKKTAVYSNTDVDSLFDLMRSKYVCAEVGNVFKEVEKQLNEGRMVLFSGTPCTVAGMRKYAQMKCKDKIENLLLVDFLCEGAPSSKVFQDYLTGLEHKYKGNVIDVQFRSKAFGWSNHCMKVVFDNGKEYVRPYIDDTYISTFVELLFNRPVCYKCMFRQEKMSDITLCDFWKVKQVLPEWIDGNYGISAVFANTEKGNDWILKQQNVKIQKLSDEQMKYALQNLNTEKEYIKRNEFMDTWKSKGYSSAIKKHAEIGKPKGCIKRLKWCKHYLKLLKYRKNMRDLLDVK
ncbi:MAG: Coenzyme F420 hydrogenase/dehydrogenase, beta subunit C-terminal domain [Lachnospiraceae bacterium]|nr:Coenzyme F420 hydrogenase/dehydrogenase, beta subunit C-terminal domain [Lachnospiraceae bacterium]